MSSSRFAHADRHAVALHAAAAQVEDAIDAVGDEVVVHPRVVEQQLALVQHHAAVALVAIQRVVGDDAVFQLPVAAIEHDGRRAIAGAVQYPC